MATQNLNEVGWFYHAPPKRKENTEPILLPATSQIPGLCQQYDQEEFTDQPREMIFKDTDTKYIRLAKEGGRKDLLVFNDKKPVSKEPKGYPRVNWFYLEDNRREDECVKKKEQQEWAFLLPDYMVHEGYQPTIGEGVESANSKKRVPFAQDNMSVFKRDTGCATDKTAKLENDRPPGYGVRISKPLRIKPRLLKVKTPKEQLREHKNTKWTRDDEPEHLQMNAKKQVDMDKLLSYAYCVDDGTWNSSAIGKDKIRPNIPDPGPNRSEYGHAFGYVTIPPASRKTRKNKKTDSKPQEKKNTEEKELFKLSRFKNIPSKIDSFQQLKQAT